MLRQARSLSLEELSRRAGVSKSMLSQIERNQANPTVAVVWRLAHALGVGIGDLLGRASQPLPPPISVVAAHDTPSLASAERGYELRILGPIELAGQHEWYELRMQPAGALASEGHAPGAREHLTLLAGELEVGCEGQSERLHPGETARYAADRPHVIRNPGSEPATALLVVLHG